MQQCENGRDKSTFLLHSINRSFGMFENETPLDSGTLSYDQSMMLGKGKEDRL